MTTFTVVAVVAALLSLLWFIQPSGRHADLPAGRPADRRGRGTRRRRESSTAARAGVTALSVLASAIVVGAVAGWLDILVPAVLVWVASCLWLPGSARWSATAHASWSLSLLAGLAYLVTMAVWTATSGLTGLAVTAGWGLWVLELLAYVLFLSFGYEFHDALGSQRWDRRVGLASTPATGAARPFVSIHVPSHNEPPDMVIATLKSLLNLEYPHYEVLVIDNNTIDEALVAPVEAFCAAHPLVLRFHRLVDWPGYKSGALNYAKRVTNPRATLIGVVDADYQVAPDWLQDTVPLFADDRVAFVQTPQHYRAWAHSRYLRSLYYSYEYFFTVSQPSRDERDAAIFGGTMGVVRRFALEEVGGWDEWCVTEDAELSLRLLAAGWTGHHLDRDYGAGIMPLTFEALKRQRFRWCFGGMQILRKHWRELVPWRGRGLSSRQRLGYLAGGVQWFGDLLNLVFCLVVLVCLWDVALGGGVVFRQVAGLLLLAMPGLLLLGLLRAVAGIRLAGHGATWRDAVGASLVWLSLGVVVAVACVRGLTEREGVFLRTPKVHSDARPTDVLRANAVELGLAMCAVGSAAVALLTRPGWVAAGLSALLVVPVAGWLAALGHSVAALRTALPAPLQRRRDRERRAGIRPRTHWSVASILAAAALAGLIVLVTQPRIVDSPRELLSPAGPSPASTTSTTPPGVAPQESSTTTDPANPAAPRSTSVVVRVTAATTSAPSPTFMPTGSPTSVPSPTSSPTSAPGRSPTAPPGSPTTHPSPTTTR